MEQELGRTIEQMQADNGLAEGEHRQEEDTEQRGDQMDLVLEDTGEAAQTVPAVAQQATEAADHHVGHLEEEEEVDHRMEHCGGLLAQEAGP